jgi:hypothetical protein
MPKVEMSPKAITTRLKRVEQLRRLGLSLKKARIKQTDSDKSKDAEIQHNLRLKDK